LVFGFGFLGAAVALYFSNQIPSSWSREDGTITSYTTSLAGAGNSGPSYCAIITYKVANTPYTVDSHSCGGGVPAIGAPAQVAYNPSNPADSKVVPGLGGAMFIALAGIVGLALLILAPVAFVKSKKNPDPSVFTTQWPHAPNPVATPTTMPPGQASPPVQPASPAPPDQPAPPPADQGNPSV
jgi:hypothetical protein